ncbi:helix-turn-helix domain-containing protein [Methylobacterium sp. ARG-1]|uniref:helix-turn-helix domain-containing protein n=1 Tax=Methylobacterium sp. ARG-1 TaxID=1692501 RepID=UPI0009E6B24B|nr:helix-turn-helix domain-containing protein [Methylobacterium sp. ARG-1]
MAAEAGLSLRSLHRHVRDATGQAPGTWLIAERLAEARAMLEETTRSVDEIARLVRFGSAPALRSHFRSLLGVTPTAYRGAASPPDPRGLCRTPPEPPPQRARATQNSTAPSSAAFTGPSGKMFRAARA